MLPSPIRVMGKWLNRFFESPFLTPPSIFKIIILSLWPIIYYFCWLVFVCLFLLFEKQKPRQTTPAKAKGGWSRGLQGENLQVWLCEDRAEGRWGRKIIRLQISSGNNFSQVVGVSQSKSCLRRVPGGQDGRIGAPWPLLLSRSSLAFTREVAEPAVGYTGPQPSDPQQVLRKGINAKLTQPTQSALARPRSSFFHACLGNGS